MPVDSQASPNDEDRDGVRGEWGYACGGDDSGDIGAIIPSALRDDDRRRPGIKPNSSRGSRERDLCIVGVKDVVAERAGEFMVSRVPSLRFNTNAPGEAKKSAGILTGRRERIVVGAQAEEKEQRREPDADPKESRHVTEGGRLQHGPAAICLVRQLARLVRDMCEVEEPHKMVDDDQKA